MIGLKLELSRQYLGTPLRSWLIAIGLAVAVTLGLLFARSVAIERARRWSARTETRLDDLLVGVLGSLRSLFFAALGLWVATEYVRLSKSLQHSLRTAVILLTLIQIGLSVQATTRTLSHGWTGKTDDGEARTAASATAFLVSLIAWALLAVMGLSRLGVEISALVAGLGVGGVAAALAVQNILGDLLASLSIYFDRPFHIGDFIVVGNEMGTVERIGLRTTRVRSLGGEEMVFANGDLTKSRIRNFKRMQERRVSFGFGVEYTTSLEQLRQIPAIVEAIVRAREGTRFDRAHFKDYGPFSLNFEVVYFVLSPDHNLYMNLQQTINLELFREFAERRIQFAFPTQKLLLSSQTGPER
jgi:small-conductance mechanosensitive channel